MPALVTASPDKAKPGRKPLADGEGKTARLQLKTRPDQKAAYLAKAKAAGLTLNAWAERALDRAK